LTEISPLKRQSGLAEVCRPRLVYYLFRNESYQRCIPEERLSGN
jgi:hypothetical protein